MAFKDTRRDTEKARAAAAEAVAGSTSRAVGAAKKWAALHWVYRWGWSTPAVLDLRFQRGRRGLAARLLRQGLLRAHPCAASGGVRGIPRHVLTLTEDGVAQVEEMLDDAALLGYRQPGDRHIVWRQLRHDLMVQRLTATQLGEEAITAFETPRELAERSAGGQKQPDAAWRSGGRLVAVELELSAKVGAELDRTVAALLACTRYSAQSAGPYDGVLILTHSRTILGRYRRALTPGARLQLWERNALRHWVRGSVTRIPEWAAPPTFLYKKVAL